ncbi:MAG: PilZ domain-containing protein [Nitrospiraceae bacterium]
MSKPLRCPLCGKNVILRAQTRTLSESFLTWLFIAPFRCQSCHHRFFRLRLGVEYPSSLIDRREHLRIPVRLFLSFSGGRIKGEGFVTDMSMGGCMIQSSTHVKVDDIFYLHITLPNQEKSLELAAIVRSVTSRGVSFQFLRQAQESKSLLSFIQAQARGGGSGTCKTDQAA